MQGLLYGVRPEQWTPPDESNHLLVGLSKVPMVMKELERPGLVRDDWAVAKTRLTGICGSDAKMVFMDFGDDFGDSAVERVLLVPHRVRTRGRGRRRRGGAGGHDARGRPASRPQPVALLRATGHRPPVPLVPGW